MELLKSCKLPDEEQILVTQLRSIRDAPKQIQDVYEMCIGVQKIKHLIKQETEPPWGPKLRRVQHQLELSVQANRRELVLV